MKKALVIGRSGQLGSAFSSLSSSSEAFAIRVIGRPDVDMLCAQSITEIIAQEQPNIVINASAYTAVDDAEQAESDAFALNATATAHLATACEQSQIPLLHISTDYVFDGSSEEPYQPNDPVAPINAYGRTKLAGEWACQACHPNGSYIIRTSWVFSEYGNNFVKTMLKLAETRDELAIVNDQYGAPTYARDLATACLEMAQQITSDSTPAAGLYHITNTGFCSWHGFATEILKDHSTTVNETSSANFPRPAQRPQYSKLCTTSTQKTFQLSLRPWQDALADCLQALPAQH